MNKYFLIGLLLIIIPGTAYFIWSKTTKQTSITVSSNQTVGTSVDSNITSTTDSNASQNSQRISEKRISVLSSWKIYTNNKLGFTFQYPAEWVIEEKDNEVIDRSNNVIAVETNFIDTAAQTSLLVACQLSSNAKQLYDYAVSQQNSTGGTQITIAGTNAIQSKRKIVTDGRGHGIKPYEVIVVDFLNRKQPGEIQLQFNTALPAEIEVTKFNQLLSTFKFIP